jgi:hypothetical protein
MENQMNHADCEVYELSDQEVSDIAGGAECHVICINAYYNAPNYQVRITQCIQTLC